MKREDWTITESSERPAGKRGECFYCNRNLGEQHASDCVIRSRTVAVDFTIQTVMNVPEYWSPEQVEHHYNDGHWCADNLIKYLERREEETGRCMCLITKAKYKREATSEDESTWGYNKIADEDS